MKPILLATVVLACCTIAMPCTLIRTGSLVAFDKSESIFIGKVVGYTEAPVADEHGALTGSNAAGVIVRVTEEVFLPAPTAEVEVYNYLLMADCSTVGSTRDRVETEFPIGTEVRVIGESPQLTKGSSSRPRVEVRPPGPGYIVLNSDSTSPRLTTATSVFDYQKYRYDRNRSYAYNSLPNFEFRKDLLRLARAQKPSDREAIRKRLSFASEVWDFDVDLASRTDSFSPATVPLFLRKIEKKN